MELSTFTHMGLSVHIRTTVAGISMSSSMVVPPPFSLSDMMFVQMSGSKAERTNPHCPFGGPGLPLTLKHRYTQLYKLSFGLNFLTVFCDHGGYNMFL